MAIVVYMASEFKSNIKPNASSSKLARRGIKRYKREIISIAVFVAFIAVVLLVIYSHYLSTQRVEDVDLGGGRYIQDIFYIPPVCNLPPILPIP